MRVPRLVLLCALALLALPAGAQPFLSAIRNF